MTTPYFGGGPPSPFKFSQPPVNTGPQSPLTTTPSVGGGSPFTSAQQAQLQSAFSAAGIWDTIQGVGGDVWGAVSKILPKDANGNVDWGKLGGDIMGWVKNNKDTILSGLNAYEQYSRQQQSDKYAKQGLDLATQSYAEKAPLRAAGQAGMLDPHAGTPDLSGLKTQSQSPLAFQAPTPPPLSMANMQNAQQIAGPRSGNPFASALPVAGTPGPVPPSNTAPPMRPLVPRPPTALPISTDPNAAGQIPPQIPAALPLAQSGPIRNVMPKNKQWTMPSGIPLAKVSNAL